MIFIGIYILGVVIGHYLLSRLIKRRAVMTDDTRRYRADRVNPLFRWESKMYLRQIWFWPVYVSLIFPVRYTWRGIILVVTKLGFGEVYKDMADAIKRY